VDTLDAQPPRPGEILAGKYRVERVLGRGGAGTVYLATHLELERPVALKFLIEAASPTATARLQREAKAVARLRSEHVARVLDVVRLENGTPFIVMEYLEGRDLARELAEAGVLPPERAVLYLLHACEAIAEAHAAGIVHRDLKPANLFLTLDVDGAPCVKVVDFGISKSVESSSLTHTGAVLGSPLYMAPEQISSAKLADERTDIWALGAVLYELVAGEPPFEAASLPELCMAVVHRPHTSAATRVPGLPPGLSAVIDRCLSKAPEDRYETVGDLAQALGPYAPAAGRESVRRASAASSRRRPRASLAAPAADKAAAAQRDASGSSQQTQAALPERAARRVTMALAGALLVVAAAVAAILGFRRAPAVHEQAPASGQVPAVAADPFTRPSSTPQPSAAIRSSPQIPPARKASTGRTPHVTTSPAAIGPAAATAPDRPNRGQTAASTETSAPQQDASSSLLRDRK
jgi:eukaryotic-like serine/threonine-protein kinase